MRSALRRSDRFPAAPAALWALLAAVTLLARAPVAFADQPPPGPLAPAPPTAPPAADARPGEPGSPVAARAAAPAAAAEKNADASPRTDEKRGFLDDDQRSSKTRTAAWIGVAATVAFLTCGGIFALAAQSRSDEIGRREQTVGADGQPLRFDAATEQQLGDLRTEGQTFDRVAIAMFTAAGVVAVTSGVLFYLDHRGKSREGQAQARRVPLLAPGFGPRQAGLSATWSF